MNKHDATEQAYKNGYEAGYGNALVAAEELLDTFIDARTSVTVSAEYIAGLQRARKIVSVLQRSVKYDIRRCEADKREPTE